MKFLNNGNLATTSSDKTIKIWDMNTFKLVYSFEAHNRSILALTVFKNGDLVSSSADKSIKIWNTNLFYNISTIH